MSTFFSTSIKISFSILKFKVFENINQHTYTSCDFSKVRLLFGPSHFISGHNLKSHWITRRHKSHTTAPSNGFLLCLFRVQIRFTIANLYVWRWQLFDLLISEKKDPKNYGVQCVLTMIYLSVSPGTCGSSNQVAVRQVNSHCKKLSTFFIWVVVSEVSFTGILQIYKHITCNFWCAILLYVTTAP